MLALASTTTAAAVAWAGDMVQQSDNHIGMISSRHPYRCSWLSLAISLSAFGEIVLITCCE
jgi:hypothetical protein